MVRWGTPGCLFLLLVYAMSASTVRQGSPDPAFGKIPFDDWLKESGQRRVRWSLRTARPVLSIHQRLLLEVEIRLDGGDVQERLGKGELVTYLQLTDAGGRRYQTHTGIDIAKLEADVKSDYIACTEYAFVLPGDYQIAAAVQFTATGDHSTRQDRIRVQDLRSDPLPDSWHGLPAVEFIPASQQPESWFLPSLKGRLNLPVNPKHEVRIDVVANVSPSEQPVRGRRAASWHPGLLIPMFKASSEITAPQASVNAELVDVLRRKVLFRQADVMNLDWQRLRSALVESSTGTIDIKALEDRHRNLAFLISELNQQLAGPGPSHRAVILLSNIVQFESNQDLGPQRLARCQDCRLFYIRLRPPVQRPSGPMIKPRIGRRMGIGRGVPYLPDISIDQIEPALKPLSPRVFDVGTPEQFRKALADILEEIGAL